MNSFPLPGAPVFHRSENGALMIEDLGLDELAQEHGTPLFVYSQAAIESALSAWQRGLAGRDALVCYAVKANSSQAILSLLAQAGCGFDIVSGGELARALAAGAEPGKIVFSGVGKTRREMQAALEAGIGCFNVESEAELLALNDVAAACGLTAPVSIRVNPDVDARTHPYISTGLRDNKFGIAHGHALAACQLAASLPGLRVAGIGCHIGSQITEAAPYLDALERVLDLLEAIEAAGVPLGQIDLGGGLGIAYADETPPAADALCQLLLARLDARGHGQRRLIVEPGRALVGNAGVCLTEVLYLKPGEDKGFCIVDAAMNDVPRPALYEAFHRIEPLQAAAEGAPERVYDVVGPVCESGDWLGRRRLLAVQPGDRLAVFSAGAYCMSMASNYNSRPRAAEVLVSGGMARVIRQRETIEDLLRGELP
ncbi:diaminopimelate decarboxylase [Ottowia sp. oral taxon 894]|uniref:diaminopimelate decarboxylase n=1 Tax=Ottowia sp. oral taxon 894 TaxID=1658672 RepID=UPI000683721C|nr:diaminopimelate decarboxylase [Ottowia sp. oral taxon 894]AKU67184.1 diaminopimelate decarboxylase [Ottowia sp. oral taxon 894]